jgi:hypothetical protein
MLRYLSLRGALTGALLILAGCGLGESAASAAAGGVSKAEEVKQGRATQERVEQQLEDAQAAAAAQRAAAEAASE